VSVIFSPSVGLVGIDTSEGRIGTLWQHVAVTSADVPGDEDAFHRLVEPHVRELHVHCYRMLGSVDDADELLQETLLAAWQGLPDFEGRSSLRTWLYRIATNRCLNAIRDGKRRPPAVPVPPFEPPPPTDHHPATWVQPYVTTEDPADIQERREHVELAFITALQTTPPRQTAALVLVDVLGFSMAEAADLLVDVGPTAVKGLLQRARSAVGERTRVAPRPDADAERVMAERFARAYSGNDVDGVLALLTDQAWLAMPPAPHLYRGVDAIGTFLEASIAWRRDTHTVSFTAVRANAAPAYSVEMSGPEGRFRAGIVVLDLTGQGIAGITHYLGDWPITLPQGTQSPAATS